MSSSNPTISNPTIAVSPEPITAGKRAAKPARRLVAALLVGSMSVLSLPVNPAMAGLVGTDSVVAERSAAAARERVAGLFERADVRAEFGKFGIAPDEAAARVAALSDAEIAAIDSRLAEDPAGEGAVGAIVGAALIVFIILLVTDLAGLTDVFGFTKKGALKSE